ncbi:transcriptional regulator [Bacterioplanes sanyensis]|uniref:Transcriptional regulator n=1 Tax=Bacterioplanes sanyensis TaxID=1249553 RepID=A0A222FHA1_9GAMM|nr:helix-turn-helix domain-containing protein [Bacterioplanes sanyensis]ASP38447.1 transcriptional regulator [Bacterioplanes sanyensis]
MPRRSDCPISNVLDHVGDKWSLLILRDLMFFAKHSYSELQNSDERIASNILSARLTQLEKDGLIQKRTDPNDKRKRVYALTKAGKDMLPILLEMIAWSGVHDPNTNAPKTLLQRIRHDRTALIDELRQQSSGT